MDGQNFSSRPMVQGNWTCGGCGATITELPFEPDGTRPVYCRDCHRSKNANAGGRDNNRRRDFAPRQMVQGNWACSECGATINELPFEPSGDQPIFCGDCYRAKRADRPARRRF